MGACKTKLKQNPDNLEKKGNTIGLKMKTTLNSTLDSKPKRLGIMQSNTERGLNSPFTAGYNLSNRHQTRTLGKRDTEQSKKSPQKGLSLIIETNASKFYSQQKRQTNHNINILQNNKNGLLVEMETISKQNPQSLLFVEWLLKSEIDHPNIIKLYEVFQTQDQYQIIYEHFDGIPLKELIIDEESKVTKKLMAQIIDQILSAINYLHSINQIHGHLTLDCFRIQQNENEVIVKLTNMKKIIMKESETEEFEELLYFPPECIYHPEKYSKTRDLWAIGLMAFTLRKGKLPYVVPLQLDTRYFETQSIIHQYKFQFQHKKDKVYQSFLNSLLNKEPKSRKSCSDLLSHPFITNNRQIQNVPQIKLLKNLLHAKSCCLLQELLIGYFLQEFQWEEYILIKKLFHEGDQDMDGFLSKSEIVQLFSKYFKEENNIENQIHEFFILYELEKVGGMNYQHFQAMTVNRQQLLTIGNIEICFQILSIDKKDITLKNLKRHLNYDSNDLVEEFANLTNEANKLSIAQFIKLMQLLL